MMSFTGEKAKIEKFKIFLFNWVYIYNIPLKLIPEEAAKFASEQWDITEQKLVKIVAELYKEKFIEIKQDDPFVFDFTEEGFFHIKKLIEVYGDQNFKVKLIE